MKESSLNQEVKEPTPESKLFGLPRPWAGALIGVLIFTLILLIAWTTESMLLLFALTAPRNAASFIAEPIAAFGNDILEYTIAYLVSAIPPAILGSLFASKKKDYRIFGVFLFVGYCISSFIVALFMYHFLFSD